VAILDQIIVGELPCSLCLPQRVGIAAPFAAGIGARQILGVFWAFLCFFVATAANGARLFSSSHSHVSLPVPMADGSSTAQYGWSFPSRSSMR
jgi:disulfide bond formation protein DsbB